MEKDPIHFCRVADCPVQTTGRCLEGLDLDSCPNYSEEIKDDLTELEEDIVESPEDNVTDEESLIKLSDGEEFDSQTAVEITCGALTRVIVLAGDSDSAKTTLVLSIYEKFQEGPFAGYIFAGCQNLPSFEKRCFSSRLESDRDKADTDRTPRADGHKLLHLRVRREDLTDPVQELLFTDISGEFFQDACDSTEYCQELHVLKRADCIAVCLDGEKLLDAGLRYGVFNSAKMLIQSGLDAEMFNDQTYIDILFTKCDKFGVKKNKELQDFLTFIKEQLESEFGSKLSRLRFFEVAPRPENPNFKFAYGIDQIFPSWIENSPLYKNLEVDSYLPLAKSLVQTQFDKYLLKRNLG